MSQDICYLEKLRQTKSLWHNWWLQRRDIPKRTVRSRPQHIPKAKTYWWQNRFNTSYIEVPSRRVSINATMTLSKTKISVPLKVIFNWITVPIYTLLFFHLPFSWLMCQYKQQFVLRITTRHSDTRISNIYYIYSKDLKGNCSELD
jgi:hypothetical protein